jgi:hypothetical protein
MKVPEPQRNYDAHEILNERTTMDVQNVLKMMISGREIYDHCCDADYFPVDDRRWPP